MFPRKFSVDHKEQYVSHDFAMFAGEGTEENTVKQIMKEGVADYLSKRSVGVHINQSCCSGTKNSGYWYLYPIHISSLSNVGITEQELIQWLNFLNTSKAGFRYYYFGEQPADKDNAHALKGRGYSSNSYYWVGVPRVNNKGENTNPHFSYLHWIALRYLISTLTSSTHVITGGMYENYVAPYYYNIPRIAMMLHEEYKVPRLRAFLFAHAAGPFHGYKALFDMASTWSVENHTSKPDLGILVSEFKKIWYAYTGTSMNNTFTAINNGNPNILKIREMRAPYSLPIAGKLFADGKYKQFIKYLKDSYGLKNKVKKNVKEKVVA